MLSTEMHDNGVRSMMRMEFVWKETEFIVAQEVWQLQVEGEVGSG